MIDMSDVSHGIEIQGVYDGVCIWAMKDGTYVNRFTQESRPAQWQATEDYIQKLREQDERDRDGLV